MTKRNGLSQSRKPAQRPAQKPQTYPDSGKGSTRPASSYKNLGLASILLVPVIFGVANNEVFGEEYILGNTSLEYQVDSTSYITQFGNGHIDSLYNHSNRYLL